MSDWAYSADPAAPACTRERRCQRCPHVQQEVKHTMDWQFDYEGRHEKCRKRLDCTRCGFTEGKTLLAHAWDQGRVDDSDYSRVRKVYTCQSCLKQVERRTDSLPPRSDQFH